MVSSTIRVWLPEQDAVSEMGGLPDGLVADVWTGGKKLPDSADEVEVVVLPFWVPPSRMAVLAKLPRLKLIQLMSAGAENVVPFVPSGVTLCNARGVHDPAVAEWIMAVILAQVRQLPRFMAAQQAGTWEPGPKRAAGRPDRADRGLRLDRRGGRADAGALRRDHQNVSPGGLDPA